MPNTRNPQDPRRLGALALLCAALLCPAPALAQALKLTVRGLDKEARQNLRAHLGEVDSELAANEARLQRVLKRAVRDALQPLGYYEAGFEAVRDGPRLLIDVEPGPRVVFAAPEIAVDEPAASLPAIRELLRSGALAAGKPLSHADYDGFRDELLRGCRRLGFFDANYRRSELRIDLAARTATARLDLACGARYAFGTVEISGSRVDHALLGPLAPFRAGEPFDNELVRRFEQRLRDTGYFREVMVRVTPGPGARADVLALAEDVTTSRYELGAGFSTDSALRLRFNRDTPLLNEHGHSLRIESEFSEPRQAVEALYRIPHHDPLDDILELTAGMQGKNVQDTESLTATVGVRHAIKVFEDWSFGYGASVELERYTIASQAEKEVAYLLPATSISRTRIDPGVDPLSGSAWFSAIDFSDRVLGSPSDFLRWRGSGKWLAGLPDDNTTVLARLELGAILTDGFSNLPASLRFYAGGDNSIRGYDFEAAGPRDDEGKLTGGRYLAVGSIELSRRVLPRWRVAAFVDGGGAFTEDTDPFFQSAGLGLRWLSPVGQVRLDFAVPLRDSENSGFKLHISMGPPL
ncbi:MAG: outer membrane protein assembly factor [Pseudomonadales bacterium]|nr:outer membrane protein assembly factor [Pseudomonadales bacterium]